MPLSVRLDPKTESAVKRLARRRKQTRSQVVREAIAALEREDAARQGSAKRPWDSIAHLVGVVHSGDGSLSQNTGERFAALLRANAHARRAR